MCKLPFIKKYSPEISSNKNFYILSLINCVKSVQIQSYFWSVFSCIQFEYRKTRTTNNSVVGHFLRSDQVLLLFFRSSYLPLFYTMPALKDFITGKESTCSRASLQVFSYEFCKLLQSKFLIKHLQRRVQNPVKHRRWSVLRKYFIDYFRRFPILDV